RVICNRACPQCIEVRGEKSETLLPYITGLTVLLLTPEKQLVPNESMQSDSGSGHHRPWSIVLDQRLKLVSAAALTNHGSGVLIRFRHKIILLNVIDS